MRTERDHVSYGPFLYLFRRRGGGCTKNWANEKVDVTGMQDGVGTGMQDGVGT